MGIIEYIYQQWSSITTRLSTCILESTGNVLESNVTSTNPPKRLRDIRSERLRLPASSPDPLTPSAPLCLNALRSTLVRAAALLWPSLSTLVSPSRTQEPLVSPLTTEEPAPARSSLIWTRIDLSPTL